MFDAEIAAALGNVNAAIIVQQLNYWMNKDGVGTIIDGVKYVYNTFVDWVNQQFSWLSVWQFRKAMTLLRSLGIVKVIRYKAKQWNQTNFYSLDCDRLVKFLNLETATSTEISELCDNTPQDDNNQPLEMRDRNISYIDTKITSREKQQSRVAATTSQVKKTESDFTKSKSNQTKSSSFSAQENRNTFKNKQNISKDKSSGQVEQIINLKWKKQISDLDSVGIPINKTLIGLLKSYEFERVESAIALFKARKKEQHIPNLAGYFLTVLKENWASENIIGANSEVDCASVFRYWYDLAKELGYCSGQEMREGEQWVYVSGTWEKWSSAVERGYSLNYLKKVAKRNKNQ